jgi:hypothetical protein
VFEIKGIEVPFRVLKKLKTAFTTRCSGLACIFGVSGEKQRFCRSAASDSLYYEIMRSVRRVRVWRV